jgi:acyl-CoA synthetase (AMP-forming)/AMP-acid ligase II
MAAAGARRMIERQLLARLELDARQHPAVEPQVDAGYVCCPRTDQKRDGISYFFPCPDAAHGHLGEEWQHDLLNRFPSQIASKSLLCEITILRAVGTLLRRRPNAHATDSGSMLRHPISEAVLGRVTAALPKAQFTQAYGMTELSPAATFLHWKEQIGDGRAKRPPQGRWAHRSACSTRCTSVDDYHMSLPRIEPGSINHA